MTGCTLSLMLNGQTLSKHVKGVKTPGMMRREEFKVYEVLICETSVFTERRFMKLLSRSINANSHGTMNQLSIITY